MIKSKDFYLLIGSQLFSVIGTTVIQFAVALYILDLTHSGVTFSIIMALSVIGRLISLPFCGILADRLPKRSLMLAMDSSYMLLSLGLLFGSFSSLPVVLTGILTVIIGIVSAFETPVVQSTIPLICNQDALPRANGIISSVGMLGNIIGPVFAGLVYRFDSIYWVFIICSCLFLIAICCEIFINIPIINKKKLSNKLWQVVTADFRELFAYLKHHIMIVKICLVAFLINFLLAAFIQVVIPFISRIQFEISDTQYGLMNTCFALGSLFGTIFYGLFSKRLSEKNIGEILVITSLIFSLLVIPFGMIQNQQLAFWVMTAIIAIMMSLVTLISVQLIVYVQLISDQLLLGRIMSFVMIVATLAMPLGQVLFGFLIDYLPQNMLIVLVILVALITLSISVFSMKIFKNIRKS
ncbi:MULTISPECIES: MFS transporter [unclassified Enterococcus]|uniref:MFS transporter n=1 Tax=unclassified Enterococcus TaxID=2608891 RepID=UPI0015570803|nr:MULTISPECIES: MFS transporter [unclassified Enterococcus]MBS7577377.1 MFS transporter [Enterococcus sp. MMGLQ5-2]MBS7584784.1 MFS transporter [Enterococcus sp. MMGLQ5-1]NPD12639.1 MFS transporter [Enterococcus sp. MMGLQ5-1]NPD37211.1 MFS transporter [Enterococcus sp. MMGLQ5-2]